VVNQQEGGVEEGHCRQSSIKIIYHHENKRRHVFSKLKSELQGAVSWHGAEASTAEPDYSTQYCPVAFN
jgi:hypothetical protein